MSFPLKKVSRRNLGSLKKMHDVPIRCFYIHFFKTTCFYLELYVDDFSIVPLPPTTKQYDRHTLPNCIKILVTNQGRNSKDSCLSRILDKQNTDLASL